jgi:hypothetical protein
MTLRLAVVLLLCGAWVAAADNDTRYNPSMCKASFPCGANVNIHYPFFLANATMAIDGYDTALSYCGYPGMAVSCDEAAGRATLQLHGDNYTVLDINYADHTATVADADVLVDGGGDCPRITHNVTVPAGTWLNLSTAANDNLVFFFDCDFAAARLATTDQLHRLPGTGRGGWGCRLTWQRSPTCRRRGTSCCQARARRWSPCPCSSTGCSAVTTCRG